MPAKGCYLLCFLLEKCVVWNTALREGWRQKVETLVGRNPSFNKADLSVLPPSSNVNQHQNICSAQTPKSFQQLQYTNLPYFTLVFIKKNYKTNRAKNKCITSFYFPNRRPVSLVPNALEGFWVNCKCLQIAHPRWETGALTAAPDPLIITQQSMGWAHGSTAHTKTGRSEQCGRSPNPIPPPNPRHAELPCSQPAPNLPGRITEVGWDITALTSRLFSWQQHSPDFEQGNVCCFLVSCCFFFKWCL